MPPSATQLLPRAAFALSALQRPDMVPLPLSSAGPPYGPIELVTKPSAPANDGDGEGNDGEGDEEQQRSDDNEGNIEKPDENDYQVLTIN